MTGPALALAAAAVTIAAWPAAASQPAGISRPASPAGVSSAVRTAADHSVPLDAVSLDVVVVPLNQAGPGTTGPSAAATGEKAAKQIAWAMLRKFGWNTPQFKYLDWLWSRESSWNVRAENPYSGAYGIPQAVPGDKMASAGPSWPTDPATQIRWGMRYIKSRYGSPYGAWRHEAADGWY
ncbi:MAG: lytic transglycosylase domain-containing protein [Streptosporangiaceae bacterium]|jgi:hypothetical protein